MQSQMFEVVKSLGNKLDEVIGRQERTLSLLSTIPSGGAPTHGQLPDGKVLLLVFPPKFQNDDDFIAEENSQRTKE